jgi:hypothetical protein
VALPPHADRPMAIRIVPASWTRIAFLATVPAYREPPSKRRTPNIARWRLIARVVCARDPGADRGHQLSSDQAGLP